MNINKIAILLELKRDMTSSDCVNETRRGEYGRGVKDAIEFVWEIIDNKLQEYMNEEALKWNQF